MVLLIVLILLAVIAFLFFYFRGRGQNFSVDGETFEMYLGLPGKGKTLFLTEYRVLPALEQGLDVYVNYWVNWNGPNLHLFREFEEVESVRNAVVVFDEIGKILDPRRWDDETSGVRDFFQQHRKRHVEIYGTTQHVSLIAKSALIEVDTFYMFTKPSGFFDFFSSAFPYVVCQGEEMTLKEIRLQDSDFIVSDDGDGLDSEKKFALWYSKKKLLHSELNPFKLEYIHLYCPLCCQRQGSPISVEDTEKYALYDKKRGFQALPDLPPTFCPKHKDTPLSVRASGMYDTDYEIVSQEKPIIWRAFHRAPKEVPFRGALSPDQLAQKRSLERFG